MPMNFPDFKSLMRMAEMRKFRDPKISETEEDFRKALHEFIKPKDKVEAFEVLFGKGWDQWSDEQKLQFLQGGYNL